MKIFLFNVGNKGRRRRARQKEKQNNFLYSSRDWEDRQSLKKASQPYRGKRETAREIALDLFGSLKQGG